MPLEPFVDIHCHLVSGLDDGARTLEESLAMARLAASEGVQTIVATPHQLGSHAGNSADAIRQHTARLHTILQEQGVPIEVLPGADVRIEPDLVGRIRRGEVLTLADGGLYVLLELPHEVYLPLDRLLGELKSAGLIGILSHPERNQGILGQPRVLESLVDAGCLLQITAGSLMGTFGPACQTLAERIVTQGLAHFVATDAHGIKARRPLMRRAYQRVVELAGAEVGARLCSANPHCVVRNRPLAQAGRTQSRGWFGWRRAG